MITYHRTKTDQELEEILALQKINLSANLSEEEKRQKGFVTLKHHFEILKKMNDACAHCVAKKNGKIVGYALSMLQDFKNDIPMLIPMFIEIDKAIIDQRLSPNYIAMGQVCIAESVRGKGVFRNLYTYMAQEMKDQFDAIITELDTKNIRSSNAHKSVGFKQLITYTTNQQLWDIIILKI